MEGPTIKIKLIRSVICCSLGLKKINQIVVRPDSDSFRGTVKKIPHLLALVD